MNAYQPLLEDLGEILIYPTAGLNEQIKSCLDEFQPGQEFLRDRISAFASGIEQLSLSELEELYIKTFDLNKAGTLDLGWHLFGEDYNRGLFLVKLRQHLQMYQIPESTELPDHVSQVLRILGRMSRDEANTFAYSCVIPSIEVIGDGIREDNPYGHVIDALSQLLRNLFDVPAGFEETVESPFLELPIIQ